MVVIEPRESASDQAIAEMPRAVERRDSAGELLLETEVSGAPRHFVTERKEAGRPPAYRALAGRGGGANVRVDAAGEVEAAFRRCSNEKGKF